MPPGRFEPTISAGERPQTYALDRAATWTGTSLYVLIFIVMFIYSYCNVCSVLYILFSSCQLALFGYPG